MKTILVATDYSRCANNALEYAASLAKGLQARLVIFNAYHLAIPTATVPAYVPDAEELMSQNSERLQRLSAKYGAAYGIEVEGITTTDLVTEGIQKQLRKQQADLLVMGTKGASLVTKLLGSITRQMIKQAKVPVLVVPEAAPFKGINRVLFACDYQYLSKNSQLEPIHEIAEAFKVQVQILHIETEKERQARAQPRYNVPNLEVLLRGIKHTYHFLHEEDLVAGIEKGVEEFNGDLLVMVPHKAGFWESLFHPSLTRKMVFHTQIPLLALPTIRKKPAQQRGRDADSVVL